MTGTPAAADNDTSPIRVNQIGHLAGVDKIATIVSSSSTTTATIPRAWQVRQAGGAMVASGTNTVSGNDRASAAHVYKADFSA